MGDELYLEPNRKAQVIALLFLAFVVIIATIPTFIEPTIDHIVPGRNASSEELETRIRLLVPIVFGTLAANLVISLLGVGYFCRLGYRALKFGSFPPPGTMVVFRTRIQTGKLAVIAGCLTILCGVILGLLAVLTVYAAWLLIRIAL